MLPVVGPSPLNVNPIFEIGPLEPRYSEWLVFEGISVDEKGVQHYLGKFPKLPEQRNFILALFL